MPGLKNAELLALVQALPDTLTVLNLENNVRGPCRSPLACALRCRSSFRAKPLVPPLLPQVHFRTLPALSNLSGLEKLLLTGCSTLNAWPDTGWSELTELKKIDLFGCSMLSFDDLAGMIHALDQSQWDQLMFVLPSGSLMDPRKDGGM